MGWCGLGYVAEDQWMALVNTVMNLRVLKNAGKFLSGCPINGSSRRAQIHKLSKYNWKLYVFSM
jgi:hypothetical protein